MKLEEKLRSNKKDVNKKRKDNSLKFKIKSLHKIMKSKSRLIKKDLVNLLKMLTLTNLLNVNNVVFIIKFSFQLIFKRNKKLFKKRSQNINELNKILIKKRKRVNVFIKIFK